MLARAPDGRLNGKLDLAITNWQSLLQQARETGLLPPDQAPIIMMMAQGMSQDDSLSLPLTIADSVVYLGPMALLSLGPI